MRVLIANLKHFYQRRHLWLAYLYFGPVLFWAFSADSSEDYLTYMWLSAGFSGMLVGATSRDVMNKPFARFLPGHPSTVRMVVFLIGLAVSVLAGTLSVRLEGIDAWRSPAIFLAFVWVSMVLYLAGAELVLAPWGTRGPLTGILCGLALATVVYTTWFLSPEVQPMITRHPLWVILGGLLMGLAVWLQMGRREWSRQLSSMGLLIGRSAAARELYKALDRRYTREVAASAIVMSFFLRRMEGCPDYSGGRYVWGTLYATFGVLAAWWRWLIYAFIVVIVISGYMGIMVPFVFLWIAWAFEHMSWPPVHSVMLVPAGRRERFLALILLAGVTAGILVLGIAIVAVVSVPLSWLIPEFEVWGVPVVYHRVSVINVWVPLVVIPLLGIPHVLLPKRLGSAIEFGVVMAAPLLVMVGVIVLAFVDLILIDFGYLFLMDVVLTKPAACVTGAIILIWAFFGVACRYKARRRSLVGQ